MTEKALTVLVQQRQPDPTDESSMTTAKPSARYGAI